MWIENDSDHTLEMNPVKVWSVTRGCTVFLIEMNKNLLPLWVAASFDGPIFQHSAPIHCVFIFKILHHTVKSWVMGAQRAQCYYLLLSFAICKNLTIFFTFNVCKTYSLFQTITITRPI